MFGDPVTNPKGWKLSTLAVLSEVQGGVQLTPKRASNPIKIPYLRVANVYREKLVLDEIKSIRITKEELMRVSLQSDDILVVEGHGNREEIGRTAVWDGSIEPCVHQNHLIRVRLDRKVAEPTYVNTYLNSPGGRQQLFKFGKTTSGLNTISTSNVKSTLIMLPPLDLQRQFVAVIEKYAGLVRKLNQQMADFNQLFSSLHHRAFSGELFTEKAVSVPHLAEVSQHV